MTKEKINRKIVVNDRLTHDQLITDVINEMIRLDIRDRKNKTVQQIAYSLRSSTKLQTIKNVYNYVINKVPYKSDPPDREHITAPIHLINGNVVGEDCESMVLLLSTLLNFLGIETKYVVIAWRKYQFTHVILKAKVKDKWLILDPTQGPAGYGRSVPPNKIIRQKEYKVPKMKMTVETLEDRLTNCGCLSDCGGRCGCGGKCGKKKSNPTNQNIINIGNEITELLGNNGNNGRTIEKYFEKPVPYPVVEEKLIKERIPDHLTVQKAEFLTRNRNVPVRIITTKNLNENYFYRDWY